MLEQHSTDDVTGRDWQTDDFDRMSKWEPTCPECGGELADGQGIVGCPDCGWYGQLG